ncbi:MAG: single-stranded DNA-binding protein [Bacteroidota bacterium]
MSNTIIMQARLGKDPEVREVGDTSVCRLWVAEGEKYKDRDGEIQERTNWWGAEIWGKRGEAVAKHFNKGDGIVLTGSLRQTEKDDVKYYSIHVRDWEFPMSRKGDGDSDGGSSEPKGKKSGGGYEEEF